MKLWGVFFGLVVAGPSLAAAPTSLAALPVGPGGFGQGPFELRLWPWEGCPACVAPAEDTALYDAVRDAMLSGRYRAIHKDDIEVHILPLESGHLQASGISFRELHKRVAQCRIGAHDILPAPKFSSLGTTFALGLDCPGRSEREFVSITIVERGKARIYYLPDGPIWVVPPPQP